MHASSLVLVFLTAFAAAVVTGVAVWLARRLELLAHPVARSSHSIPTPQIGGVGVFSAFIAALLATPLFVDDMAGFAALRGALLGAAAYGLVLGLLDDMLHMGARTKMVALLVLAALPVAAGVAPGELGQLPPWVGAALAVGWIFFFINAFNFMDGVNGQAAVFAMLALLTWLAATGVSSVLGGGAMFPLGAEVAMLLLFAAFAGYLPWNFPRAATFLGDSGSLPTGAVLAVLVVCDAPSPRLMFARMLALAPFIYDVCYTLARRARRGENLFEAHRSHLYQRLLVATGWSHSRLLALHAVFFALHGAAAVVYFLGLERGLRLGAPVRIAAVAAAMVLLVAYTAIVLGAERRTREKS